MKDRWSNAFMLCNNPDSAKSVKHAEPRGAIRRLFNKNLGKLTSALGSQRL